jgi:hypothetical protein
VIGRRDSISSKLFGDLQRGRWHVEHEEDASSRPLRNHLELLDDQNEGDLMVWSVGDV